MVGARGVTRPLDTLKHKEDGKGRGQRKENHRAGARKGGNQPARPWGVAFGRAGQEAECGAGGQKRKHGEVGEQKGGLWEGAANR